MWLRKGGRRERWRADVPFLPISPSEEPRASLWIHFNSLLLALSSWQRMETPLTSTNEASLESKFCVVFGMLQLSQPDQHKVALVSDVDDGI